MKTFIKTRAVSFDEEEYRVVVNLVDNAGLMADDYLKGREPGSEAEQKAVMYKLTLERIQASLADA